MLIYFIFDKYKKKPIGSLLTFLHHLFLYRKFQILNSSFERRNII